MNRKTTAVLYVSLFLFAFVNVVFAEDQSFTSQFLGNPLLILTALIVIDLIALFYHRVIRK